MSLEASTLTIVVNSTGIADATKALADLAKAGENAEKKTSNIGSGAKQSAKDQVDAAQQAASAYNAIIDMMTEKSNTFYADKAMKAAMASQQELFDGMSMMDKLWAYADDMRQKDAAARAQQAEDIRAKQAQQLADATAASEKILAQQFDAFQKQKQMEASAQAKGDALNQAGQRAADYQKIQEAAKALAEETKRLTAAEAAEREQREQIDYMKWIASGKAAAAAAREQADALSAQQKAEAQSKAEGDAFVAMLKRQADTVGMTTKELREYNAEQLRAKAAQLGVSQAVEGHIQALSQARGPHESFNLLTAGSARELMVLGHELSQGSFQRFGGSLIVLAERINFLPSLLEKAAGAASALGMGLGLFITGIAAAVAVIAAFGVAIVKGAAEQREFNAALLITGNYAGMTADNMEAMAQSVGKANGSIGAAKKTIVELAGSGKFTADQILLISDAVVAVEHATGKSGETMIGEFEKLATMAITSSKRSYDEISRHVMELNDKYHFLTAAQYDHISALDKQGESQAAANEAEEAYASAMKKRADDIKENLGDIQKAWIHVKEVASEGWDAMLGIGKKVTPQDEIDRLKGMLETMDSRPAWFSGKDQGGGAQKQFDESRLKIVMALTAAVEEKNKADAAAIQQGKNLQDQQAGIHAIARNDAIMQQVSKQNAGERALAEEKVNNELAKRAIALDKLSQDPEIVKKALELEKKYTDDAIAAREKQITDFYSKKGPKPHTEGMSGLDKTINEINEKYDVQKRAMDNEIKLIDFKNKYGLMADEDAQAAKKELLDAELDLEKDHLEKVKGAASDFYSTDVRLMNDAASKKLNAQKQLNKVMSDIDVKNKMNDLVPDVNYAAEQEKQQKEQDNILKQIEKQTKSVQAQVDAYNNLPDAVKAVGVRQKEMASEVEQAKINSLQAEKDSLQSNDLIEQAMNKRRIDQIDKEITARQGLKAVDKAKEGNDKQNNEILGRSSALTKIATEQVKMWKDAGNEIEKSLKAAFGNSGKAAGEMFKVFAENQAQQIDLVNQIRVVKEKEGLTDEERTKQITALQDSSAQSAVAMYGNMADAASGFFDKQSTGYKVATSISKAFHLAETAMALASIPAKLAAGAATMFAQSGWGGFAGVAAMTAAVAAFGVAVSGGGGGPMSSQMQQKVQGTGTVLGAPTILDGVDVKLVGQKSDSIANSLKIAEKNSGLGLVVQNDMLSALQKLNSSIDSFATLAAQNSGLTGYTANSSKSFDSKGIGAAGAVGGAVGGAALAANLAIGMSFAFPVLGTIAGAVLGALIGHGVVGKALSSVFGGSKSVDDTGLSIGKTSLAQVAQSGLSGSQYTNTTTSGGWFRSDKHDTATQSLGSEFNDQITKVVLSMEDTLKVAAVGLGMSGDAFNQKLQSFVVDIGNISLKGMTGDEIQKTLQNVFSKLGDEMASYAFSDLQKYQKIGEGLMETVVRVANDLQQVNDVFAVLSKTIPAGLEAIKTSEALISQFGSVDNLTKGVKSYISAIYTDQEKLLPVIKSVNTAMDGLGLSYVRTKEQFKAVVDSLDLTTEAGAKMFATLMNIAPAFAQTIDDTEKLANDARSALTDAYNRESQAIKDTQSKMQSLVTTLKQLGSDSLLSDMSPLTPQEKYLEAKSQFENVAQKAQNGDVDAQGQFQAAYSAFLSASKVANASGDQYKKDFLYAQKVTQQATEWAQKQVDVAKATLDALNKQVEGLIDVNAGLLTVSQAIANLITALKGTPKGDQVANQAANNAQSAIESLYQSILHRASDSAGMQFWLEKIKEGVSLTDISKAIAGSDEALGKVSPTTSTTPAQAIAPVTAMVGTQSVAHADVVAAINDLKTTIAETGQVTANKVDNLTGAVYDSQDKAADKTVAGVSDAVASTKVGSSYKIVER